MSQTVNTLKRRPFAVSFLDVVALLGFLSLVAVQMFRFADDPGVGWHLASGLQSISSHVIPRVDTFLAASDPRPWISDQWLSDAFLAVLYEAGGFPYIY